MAGPNSFYVPDGPRFSSTPLTRGPWSPDHQHAGPPSALLACLIERTLPPHMLVARVTVEILRPVPIAPVTVSLETLRAGRKVQWQAAQLLGVDGTVLARAHALCIRTTPVALPVSGDPVDDPVPAPDDSEPFQFDFFTGEHARALAGAGFAVDGFDRDPTSSALPSRSTRRGDSSSATCRTSTFLSATTRACVSAARSDTSRHGIKSCARSAASRST